LRYLLELEVLEVEGVGEEHDEEAEEDEVEDEPGHQESTPPGPQPVGRQADIRKNMFTESSIMATRYNSRRRPNSRTITPAPDVRRSFKYTQTKYRYRQVRYKYGTRMYGAVPD